mmetsp:Transcript_63177/g.135659  ORF Transcript_63177/g.135659 Transcript_63177/m.135659 type:complete len:208 (+) Transcript_63177:390-1013(+)
MWQCSRRRSRTRQPNGCRAASRARPSSSRSTKSTWPGGRTVTMRCSTWLAWGDRTASQTLPLSSSAKRTRSGPAAASSAACATRQPCRVSAIAHTLPKKGSIKARSRSASPPLAFSWATVASASLAENFGLATLACGAAGISASFVEDEWEVDGGFHAGAKGERAVPPWCCGAAPCQEDAEAEPAAIGSSVNPSGTYHPAVAECCAS